MKKNLGVKPLLYPMPVLIVGTYGEDGVADAMNAAWGCACDMDQVCLFLSPGHKTVKDLLARGAFTVGIANAANVLAADYVGIVSANDEPDKLAKTSWQLSNSAFVDAPVIEELPLTLECTLLSYDDRSHQLVGRIVNVLADEEILNEKGRIDVARLDPIAYDPGNNQYFRLGEKVGRAFRDGAALK